MPSNESTPIPEPETKVEAAPSPGVFGPDTTHASTVGGSITPPADTIPPSGPPPSPSPAPPSGGNKFLVSLLIIVVVVAVAIVGYVALKPKATSPTPSSPTTTVPTSLAPAQVSITSTGFVPATITVQVNQGIVWTNKDTASHEVASDPYPTDNAVAGFNDTQPLATNDTFDFIFSKAGTYTYHDNLNPLKFKGTVVVKG
jgi:plastocyanin